MNEHVVEADEKSFDQVIAEGVCLVDFWAPWCGPCRMVGPVVDELAEELDGQARVLKVNVDEAPDLAARFGVQAIPYLVVLKDGEMVDRHVGVRSKNDLKQSVLAAL